MLIIAHLTRLPVVTVLIALLCPWSAVSSAPVTDPAQGARSSDRLQQLIKHSSPQQSLTIIVESNEEAGRIGNIATAGGAQLRYRSGTRYEIEVRADRAPALLARFPAETIARLSWPHEAVATTSQGVTLTGAGDMHQLGNDGAGIRIGVIDLGFSSLASAIASGDLPGGQTVTDYTGSGTGGTNHGTNVAEIVHDMAPGAELYLAKISTDVQLAQAVDDMISSGVQVINHSVSWFGAAFYDGTGPLCDITDDAEAAGILWVNAAGNSRNSHYLGTFSDTNSDLRHEFTAGQDYNTINLTAGGKVTLVLNWDAYPSTNTDYDFFLYNGDPDAGGTLVASSTNNQGGGGPFGFSLPYERIDYVAAATATHYIVVEKEGSSTPHLPLTLFSLGPFLGTKTRASSLTQPADCASALTVGATNLLDNPEGFSSEGPTTDGRNKPDISAPDRVQTSLSGSFTGTSGSSPHAAGAAALVLDAFPGFSVAQVRNELTATAHDVSSTGFDFRTGYGRLSLDADGDGVNHDDDNCLLDANATQTDTDGDGQGDACDSDDDNDGLSDSLETSIGSNPLLTDTDGDSLTDGDEVLVYGTSPILDDTDGDNEADDREILAGSDPLDDQSTFLDVAGDINGDGQRNAGDLVLGTRILIGEYIPDASEQVRFDIAPLSGGIPVPDGILNTGDYLVLQRLISGDFGF